MTEQSSTHDRSVYRRFAMGTLVAVATSSALMLRPFLFPPQLPVGVPSGPVPGGGTALLLQLLLLPGLGFFLGGAIAGTALKRSIGAALGFGVAFLIGDLYAMLSVVGTQAMTGVLGVFSGFTLAFSLVFAIAGMIGLFSAGVRGRALVTGVLGFAAGGCATVILLVVLWKVGLFGGSLLRVVFAYAIPMTLPWIIGVVLFMEGLKREQRRIL
jgi:hypothetical protein